MGLEDLTFLRTSMSTIYGGHNRETYQKFKPWHSCPHKQKSVTFRDDSDIYHNQITFSAGPSTLLILLNLRALFGNLIGMLQQHHKTAQS